MRRSRLGKALARGLQPVVVLNKVDKPAVTPARCDAVASQLFDLFAALGATDEQLDFPLLYASSKQVRAYDEDSSTQCGVTCSENTAYTPSPGSGHLLQDIMFIYCTGQFICPTCHKQALHR